MTLRDITDLTSAELRSLLRENLDTTTRNALAAESKRRTTIIPSLPPRDSRRFYTTAEVAGLFGVYPKTITRWANAGKFTTIRTIGGHRRFYAHEVDALLSALEDSASSE
jgi:excisionase family DNA binding protein